MSEPRLILNTLIRTVFGSAEQARSAGATTFLRLLRACDYAVDLRLERRIRERDGIERGGELEEVLRLVEQFPVRIDRSLRFPRWP